MIYLFKGDEKFMGNNKIEKLINEANVDPFNMTSYDCSEVNVEKAILDACTQAFLGGKKIVIIKNPVFLEDEKNNHNIRMLLKYLENPSEDCILIVNALGCKVNEKLEIYKAFLKRGIIVNTNGRSEVEFSGWASRLCEVDQVRIDKSAINLIYKTVGNDVFFAKNEIEKMKNYVGEGGLISESIAKELLSKGMTNDVFSLTNAIFERNKPKIVTLYDELTKYEKDVSVLINLISRSMKDTYIVKSLVELDHDQNSVAAYMKVTPNRAYYMLKNAKAFEKEDIKIYIQQLALLDYKIKSGQIEQKIGFERFLFSL